MKPDCSRTGESQCSISRSLPVAAGADANLAVNRDTPPVGTLLHLSDGLSDLSYIKAAAKVLKDHGADFNRPSDDGVPPLMHAAVECNVELVSILLELGADPAIRWLGLNVSEVVDSCDDRHAAESIRSLVENKEVGLLDFPRLLAVRNPAALHLASPEPATVRHVRSATCLRTRLARYRR